MRRVLAAFLGIFLVFSPVRAELGSREGFLFFQNEIPKLMISSDSLGFLVTRELEGYKEYYFEGFSLGGSSDLPQAKKEEFQRLISSVNSSNHMFFQGTADDHGWEKRANKENDRLDYTLAMTRAQWARDTAGRGFMLLPTLSRKGRGFYVYVASYSYIRSPLKKAELVDKSEKSSASDSGFRIGGGMGFSAIWSKDMSFFFPVVSFDFIRGSTEVTLMGGWRPFGMAGEPASQYQNSAWGNRSESLVAVEFTRWRDWLGLALGLNGAWETLRTNDRFTQRIFGFYAGPKICRYSQNWVVQIGANFQMMNLNGTGRNSRWGVGCSSVLKLQYFLD